MKVEIKHVKTTAGLFAIYVVRTSDGKYRSFGGDYKAAHKFVRAA